MLQSSRNSSDIEGAYAFGFIAGIGSFIFTPLVLIVAFAHVMNARPLTLRQYLAAFFVVSVPTLSFQAVAISVSFLPLFLGSWVLEEPDPIAIAALALFGSAIYACAALAAYYGLLNRKG